MNESENTELQEAAARAAEAIRQYETDAQRWQKIQLKPIRELNDEELEIAIRVAEINVSDRAMEYSRSVFSSYTLLNAGRLLGDLLIERDLREYNRNRDLEIDDYPETGL